MTFRGVLVRLMVIVTVNCAVALDCHGGNCGLFGQNDDDDLSFTTHTAKPVEKPKALNMVHEDEEMMLFRPTIPSDKTDEPKGRSLNFTAEELNHGNGVVSNKNGTKKKIVDLSDVDMDSEDEDEGDTALHVEPLRDSFKNGTNATLGQCEKGGSTYKNGEKLELGCDSICTCVDGRMDCVDRCSSPFFRRGKKIDDPLCMEKPTDDKCCAILTCTDTATEPLEICSYKNKTYNRGEILKSDCTEVCRCETGGQISCKKRCQPIKKSSDRCVEIQDPKDPCCKTVLCDVTLDEQSDKTGEETPKYRIHSAKKLNETTIKIDFEQKLPPNEERPLIDVSNDKTNWTTYTLLPGDLLAGLQTPIKYVRIENDDEITQLHDTTLQDNTTESDGCTHKGLRYKLNEEFNDGCESLCVCKESGVMCLKLECPTYFGLDVVDATCVQWEPDPPNFVPNPPHCCPSKVRCKDNGSCEYENEIYSNWQVIPSNVTGCTKKCYCEMGSVECEHVCPPVPAIPPNNLPCLPLQASLGHLPGEDCCLYWMCNHPDLTSGRDVTKENNLKEQSIKNEVEPTSEKYPPKKPLDTKNATDLFEKSYVAKPTSKTLGPLAVYENKDDIKSKLGHNVNAIHAPNISLDENHYYNRFGHESELPRQHVQTSNVGPTAPNYQKPKPTLQTVTKNKTKPNKTNSQTSYVQENPPPDVYTSHDFPSISNNFPENSNGFNVHNKATPEELLQLINQHPEFSNYPPGSILEIHNVPDIQKQQYLNPNTIIPLNGQNAYIPNQPQIHPINNLPPGFPLDMFHEPVKRPFARFPQNQNEQFPPHNGLIPNGHYFLAPENAPHHNITQGDGFPDTFTNVHGFQQSQDEVIVNNLKAIDAHTVKLAFSIPAVIVGLHGRVEVRYATKTEAGSDSWKSEVFAPPDDLLATPQLEFDLSGLLPDTEYKIKVTVTLRYAHNMPTSKIYTVRTLKQESSTLPPMIPIEPDLTVTNINDTWVSVTWRKFTKHEQQFIDGVQLRYREIDSKIYEATPYIHRAVTSFMLENLKPNTKYEVGIYFIPFDEQFTEFRAEHMVQFTTANEVNDYGFNVSLEINLVKASSVEISWAGVPYPEDKYVNIYRAIYQSESGKGDYSTFKMAKRDAPPKTVITDLKPGTRYRLWLEVYLTNGKIKTSNVQDFITKPRAAPVLGASHDKLSGDLSDERGDYYGPLVIVAILATIAILSTLVLLLILVKRHSQNKASITPPPRVSQAAYDNPTYKVEIQQETMNL